jgi:hypothetical protein
MNTDKSPEFSRLCSSVFICGENFSLPSTLPGADTMSRIDPATAKHAPEAVQPERNGSADCVPAAPDTAAGLEATPQSTGSQAPAWEPDPQEKSSVDRVEEMMDGVGEKVGSVTSKVGQQLFRLAARARESLEDFWAEAQSIRRVDKEEPPAS